MADVNEVIQKFITQEQTHDNLVAMTKDAQSREFLSYNVQVRGR